MDNRKAQIIHDYVKKINNTAPDSLVCFGSFGVIRSEIVSIVINQPTATLIEIDQAQLTVQTKTRGNFSTKLQLPDVTNAEQPQQED